jgi:hypothetical protein
MRIPFAPAAVILLGLTSGCLFDRDERVYFELRGTVSGPDEIRLENVTVTLSQSFTEWENDVPMPRGEVVTDSTGAYDFGVQELRDEEGTPLLEGIFLLHFKPETPAYRSTRRDLLIEYDNKYTIDVTLDRQ